MLSLVELERVAAVLEAGFAGHRVQAVVQPDATSVVLELYGPSPGEERGARRHLLVSCRPGSARVSLLEGMPAAPSRPSGFAQYLRAHAVGAQLASCRLLGRDRQLAVRLRAREGDLDLLLAIFGRRSNVFVLDAAGNVVASLRPLSDTRPELSLGAPWEPPRSGPPRAGEDRFADVADADLLAAIEAAYAPAERDEESAALRRRLEGALRKELRRVGRKLEKLEREIEAARGATDLERQGQLLKGVLSQVKRGDREVIARDYETGEEVAIALDPLLSPSENLERCFERYRKAVRTLTKAGAQEEAVRADRDALAALEAALPEDDAALEAFAQRAEVKRVLAKHAPEAPPARPAQRGGPPEISLAGRRVPARLVPRRYRSESGLEIWVGRSDAGNDFLTTRLARGNDLFFHLDGAPGSHVVLRTAGRSDPPSEAVLDACELAVHYSKQKNATRADVHVVPIKNVRKPKGAKSGLVTVHGGKTVHLRRLASRLERILASRVDGEDARTRA